MDIDTIRELSILEIITEERLDLKFFVALQATGNREVLEWCMKKRLLHSFYKCPSCGLNMKLVARKEKIDGFNWSCRNFSKETPHYRKISVRKNSIFSKSNLTLSVLIFITAIWINGGKHEFISNELDLSKKTVFDWIKVCRELCIEMCVRESEMLGGMDVIIEIDVSRLEEKKCKKGNRMQGKYVVSGLNSYTNKFFVRIVDNPKAETILAVLKEYVLPGSIIVSDCWKLSECLADSGLQELRATQNVTFAEFPLIGEFGEQVDSSWKKIEETLSKTRHVTNLFDSHKAEYLWQKKNAKNTSKQKVEAFFSIISLSSLNDDLNKE